MQKKQQNPAQFLAAGEPSPEMELYLNLSHLKQLYRRGWLQRGIPPEYCETVADHSYAVAFLAMALADSFFPELDTEKILRLAILHDFGEILAGDITPADGVPAEEKRRLERDSVSEILKNNPNRERYEELWEEYDSGGSPEARFVHQVEKLEMGLQATVYEMQGQPDLGDFLQSAARALHDSHLIRILEDAKRVRAKAGKDPPGDREPADQR